MNKVTVTGHYKRRGIVQRKNFLNSVVLLFVFFVVSISFFVSLSAYSQTYLGTIRVQVKDLYSNSP